MTEALEVLIGRERMLSISAPNGLVAELGMVVCRRLLLGSALGDPHQEGEASVACAQYKGRPAHTSFDRAHEDGSAQCESEPHIEVGFVE